MARSYSDRVDFIGVPGRDRTDPMEDFVAEFGLGHMPHAVDVDGSLWIHFGVPGQPAWVFIDDGGEVSRHQGSLSRNDLERVLDGLFAP